MDNSKEMMELRRKEHFQNWLVSNFEIVPKLSVPDNARGVDIKAWLRSGTWTCISWASIILNMDYSEEV